MLRIEVQPRAQKELLRIPKQIRLKIIKQIDELGEVNHPLQYRRVKKLRGRKFEEYRLRVGDYRVKFIFVKPNIIKITRFQHRQVGY